MIYSKLYNSFFFRGVRSLLRKLHKEKDKNKAHFGVDILNSVSQIDDKIFPMFGTLLSICRDGQFIFADDFDFAVLGDYTDDIIDRFEEYGFELIGLSTVGHKKKLVELSFHKVFEGENVKVDLFKLDTHESFVRHCCPNFRKEKERVLFINGLKLCNFNSYFTVDYPPFSLVESKFNILIPSCSESIFSCHYGKDWMVPKKSNFIDFNNYKFINEPSCTIIGDSKRLKKFISENIDISNIRLN